MDPEDLERTLGRNVRAVRIAHERTQVELADRANVSVGALKHLESGAGSTIATLVKILRALGEEEWLDTLAPAPAPFNPLDLLAVRERSVRTDPEHRRVRRRSGPSV